MNLELEDILDLLRRYNLAKLATESYKHSIQYELAWRFRRKFSNEKKMKINLGEFDIKLEKYNRGIEKDLAIQKTHEEQTAHLLDSLIEEGMYCVDIGANMGYYTLKESLNTGKEGNVLAIEPQDSVHERLEENIDLNGINNVECLKVAVGEKERKSKFLKKRDLNLSRIASRSEEKKTGGKIVKTRKLDEIVDSQPDFVRMDVEGYESKIVKGMKEILGQDSIKLLIEVHNVKMEDLYDEKVETFWNRLADYNLELKYMVRHPNKVKPKYFLKKKFPPRKISEVGKNLDSVLNDNPKLLSYRRPFRVFLEK